MRVIAFIKKCTESSLWGWFETDKGFNIRKPLWMYPDLVMNKVTPEVPLSVDTITRKSLWQHIKEWFLNLIR